MTLYACQTFFIKYLIHWHYKLKTKKNYIACWSASKKFKMRNELLANHVCLHTLKDNSRNYKIYQVWSSLVPNSSAHNVLFNHFLTKNIHWIHFLSTEVIPYEMNFYTYLHLLAQWAPARARKDNIDSTPKNDASMHTTAHEALRHQISCL